jgi:hypothetical protein
MTVAYLYKWVHLPTGKWYVGSRTSRGCHPNDGYICSSVTVKPLILESRQNWKRTILKTGEATYIRKLEGRFLSFINAADDQMSYNKNNANGNFTTTNTTASEKTRAKMRASHRGKHEGEKNNFYGKKHTAASIEKSKRFGPSNGMYGKFGIDNPNFGKSRSDESKEKYKLSKLGDNHPSANPKNHRKCEWCGSTTKLIANYVRWHGDNCKKRTLNV